MIFPNLSGGMKMKPMRMLLDTNALIWWLEDDQRYRDALKNALLAAETLLVSHACLWEIIIKSGIGKLPDYSADIIHNAERLDYHLLPMSVPHFIKLRTIPHHHNDPFDRMIIAQAMQEDATILTGDKRFMKYDVNLKML